MLPGTDLPEALEVAERLRGALAGRSCETLETVTASFGVAQYRSGEQVETLLKRADQMLYGAKERGRNRVLGDESLSGVTLAQDPTASPL